MSTFQISVHAADVKQVLRVFSIEVAAREKDDLKEEPIVVKLRKVCPTTSFSRILGSCTVFRLVGQATMVYNLPQYVIALYRFAYRFLSPVDHLESLQS
jgi:hypothetical protein